MSQPQEVEREPARSGARSTPDPVTLTPREQQILLLLAAGHSRAEIARELGISPPTVNGYIEQMYRVLGAKNRVQAINRGRELGLC